MNSFWLQFNKEFIIFNRNIKNMNKEQSQSASSGSSSSVFEAVEEVSDCTLLLPAGLTLADGQVVLLCRDGRRWRSWDSSRVSVWGWNRAQISPTATSAMVFSTSAAKQFSLFTRTSSVKQPFRVCFQDITETSQPLYFNYNKCVSNVKCCTLKLRRDVLWRVEEPSGFKFNKEQDMMSRFNILTQ